MLNETKPVLYFVLLMLSLASLFCSPFQHPIVGKWKYDSTSDPAICRSPIEFLNDGTFVFPILQQNISGKYRVIDDTRVEVTIGASSFVISYSISGDALRLDDGQWFSSQCRYVRAK